MSPKRQWQHFKDTPSGQRFQTRYRMRRSQTSGVMRKILLTGAGVLLVLIGVALLVLPGPGLLTMVIGAALIAEESLIAARALDRLDLVLTHWLGRWRAWRSTRKQTTEADRG